MSEQLLNTMRILKLVMDNPVSRAILRAGTGKCKAGKARLEHALEIFSGISEPHSLSCRLYSGMIDLILSGGARIFNVKKEAISDYFKETVTRRGVLSVLRGIASHGIVTPQILDAPFLVVWNYTNLCNLKCKHCYQSAGQEASDELTTEERRKVINELYDAGVVSIAFSGGEPLMRRDFYEIANMASSKGIYVALASNGTLITKEIAKKLVEAGVHYIEISLDSTIPEVHDSFRGVKGAFEKTMEGIKNCVDVGIYTCIATTITKLNFKNVKDVIALAEEVGANRCIFFNFIPEGRGKDIVDLDLTPEEREEVLKQLTMSAMERKIEILSTAPQFARVNLQFSEGKVIAPTHFYIGGSSNALRVLAEFIGGCGAGRLYCALQPNGDVTPCVFMRNLIVGNIIKEDFLDIWQNNEVMKLLRDRSKLKGHCKNCEYKFVCGGCRARALAYFDDIMGPDPGCINNIQYYNTLLKVIAKPQQIVS